MIADLPGIYCIADDVLIPLDPEKVSPTLNMPMPHDIAAVRRFNGTVNCLAKFLPHLLNVIKPLSALTCEDVAWTWGPQHESAVNTVKQPISQAPVLRHYDPKEDLTVQCDASKDGLGACLLQRGQPLTYASRMLTSAEQNYAQMEKETRPGHCVCPRTIPPIHLWSHHPGAI